jgi:hypothetical protein
MKRQMIQKEKQNLVKYLKKVEISLNTFKIKINTFSQLMPKSMCDSEYHIIYNALELQFNKLNESNNIDLTEVLKLHTDVLTELNNFYNSKYAL